MISVKNPVKSVDILISSSSPGILSLLGISSGKRDIVSPSEVLPGLRPPPSMYQGLLSVQASSPSDIVRRVAGECVVVIVGVGGIVAGVVVVGFSSVSFGLGSPAVPRL